MDVEAGVRPRENALGPFRAQQLLADKHRQDLAGEDLAQMVSPFPPYSCNPDSLSIRPVLRFWFYGTAGINPLKNLKGSEGRPVQAFSPARTKWKKTLGPYSHP
jgi:hypothetical protein